MKILKYLFVCGIIAMSSLITLGQERQVPERDYWSAISKASEIQRNLPHRITQTDQYYQKGAVSKNGKIIVEQMSLDRIRSFEQTTTAGKTTTNEAIKIAGKSYCKENNQPWKVTEYFCGYSGLSTVASNSVMSFYASKVELDRKPVTLYRLWVKEPRNSKAPSGFPDVFEYKTWIGSDGRTIREETTTSLSSTETVVYSGIKLYEYNPKRLKIEAPIK